MKIELNTNTKKIREIKTKTEEKFDEQALNDLEADALVVMCYALGRKIAKLAKNEGEHRKLKDYVSSMIAKFSEGVNE